MAQKSLLALVLILVPSSARAEPAEETINFYQALKKVPTELEASSLVFGAKVRAAVALANADTISQMKIALADVLLTLHRIKADSKMLAAAPSLSGKGLAGAVDIVVDQVPYAAKYGTPRTDVADHFKRPDFAIFNRPLAALDLRAQEEIIERVLQWLGETPHPTAIVWVVGNPTLARFFERVTVFEEGRIVEDGHPGELAGRNGTYARLVA